MGTEEERKTNRENVEKIIKLCANGNKYAEDYLTAFAYVARVFDDLIDKDFPVTDIQICRAFFVLSAELWMNPFFLKHSRLLISLHVASFNAFMDSNIWEKSEERLERVYAHVMKDFSNELLGLTAFLTGGYEHMRRISLQTKELFIEEI